LRIVEDYKGVDGEMLIDFDKAALCTCVMSMTVLGFFMFKVKLNK
jgi:hypothetical protein